MRSSQLNFHLSYQDSCLFDSRLFKVQDLVVVKVRSASNNPHVLENTIIKNMGKEPLKIMLVRESDLKSLVFRRVEKMGHFRIDTLKSPVIEYSRCFVSDEIIRRGRLYCQNSFFDENGDLRKKPAEFLKWRKRIFEKARVGLIFDADRNCIGSGALMDKQNGKKLVFM